ncbi:MAG: smalltalk protein [Bacteroides sp.]|nr:smalltalk protein [Bacteroides sp.]
MSNNENNNKTMWGKILHVVITILTAIATTFGVTSCMGL